MTHWIEQHQFLANQLFTLIVAALFVSAIYVVLKDYRR